MSRGLQGTELPLWRLCCCQRWPHPPRVFRGQWLRTRELPQRDLQIPMSATPHPPQTPFLVAGRSSWATASESAEAAERNSWPNVKSNRRKLSLLWGGGGDGPLSSWWPAWHRRRWSACRSSRRAGERSAIVPALKNLHLLFSKTPLPASFVLGWCIHFQFIESHSKPSRFQPEFGAFVFSKNQRSKSRFPREKEERGFWRL